tara:strand:- start:63 stop:689 length:627 start_codon:yes stop_codon:yes gene_type:complete
MVLVSMVMSKSEALSLVEKEALNDLDLPLREGAKNLVFGKGNPDASIMFIGEAAGRNEDEQGEPFVGAAGKNLDKLLESVGLSMNDVYIANILKYRPPENRDPLPEEIRAHTPYLIKQIKVIQPKIVCSLGNYATKFLMALGNVDKMKDQPGITSVHGRVQVIEMDGLRFKLIPLFHPAAIIYNRSIQGEWEKDMGVVKGEVRQRTLF